MRSPHQSDALLHLACLVALLTVGCGLGAGAGDEFNAPAEGCVGVADQTVRWIVPFSPGGGYDIYSRLLEPFYEAATGAEIVVQNRVGAGGRVGARMIRDAEPDGRTLGILNATALLVAELSEDLGGFHPVNDFTVLGRIAIAGPVWVTGPSSRYRSMEDVLIRGSREPILFGINHVGDTGFFSAVMATELLGLDIVYLAGYPGTRESSLGLIRGEFDLMGTTFQSIRDRVETGDLTPILQISDRRVADHPSLHGVPLLAGPGGLVARRARERGVDPESAVAQAAALTQMFEAGRIVVAPPGLAPDLTRCLSNRLGEVARSAAFVAAAATAQRSVSYEEPSMLAAKLQATAGERRSLGPMLRRHLERALSDSGR